LAQRTTAAVLLMGPTAAGKTDLAMQLADVLPCDLISVDSVMVYKGMDIGSAKPDADTLSRYPHRLIDINDPAQPYSAACFHRDALQAMQEVVARKRIPLLVGGTMLYFKTLLHGIADMPSADPWLRQQIVSDAASRGWPALHLDLGRLDPVAAARIHPNNRQRIQRALEVCLSTGKRFSDFWADKPAGNGSNDGQHQHLPQDLSFRFISLAVMPEDREQLNQNILRRFDSMLTQGLVEEVYNLFGRADLSAEVPAMRAVGYRQVWQYLSGELSREEMRSKAIIATRQLAKRQMTWLRAFGQLHLLAAGSAPLADKAQSIIYSQLQSCNS